MFEDPIISEINRIGYPINLAEQHEHAGIDYFGDEIVEYDGEVILKENLEKFLSEEFGFSFQIAK